MVTMHNFILCLVTLLTRNKGGCDKIICVDTMLSLYYDKVSDSVT